MIIVFMVGCAAGILAGAYLSLLALSGTRKARKKKRRKEKRVRDV